MTTKLWEPPEALVENALMTAYMRWLDRARLEAIAGELPADWADGDVYAAHLAARLEDRSGFVEEAERARA